MTIPIIPQAAPADAATLGAGPALGGNPDATANVAAEFRAALATALGITVAEPRTPLRRNRTTREHGSTTAPVPATPAAAPRGVTRLAGETVWTSANDVELTAPSGAEPAPTPDEPRPMVAAECAPSFAPVDLGTFASSREGAGVSLPVPDEARGAMLGGEEPEPATGRVGEPPVIGGPVVPMATSNVRGPDYVSAPPSPLPTTLDPRSVPSIPQVIDTRTTELRSDLSVLRPEFRERLERVIDRMQHEFGYSIEVVETGRSQERQEDLFSQGRTRPGPVVTWTRASNHTMGLAADVTVNGGWTDRVGFEQLARIARSEGLRTLWPRDPGHIELVGPVDAPDRVAHTAPIVMRSDSSVATVVTPRPAPAREGLTIMPVPRPAPEGVAILPFPVPPAATPALPPALQRPATPVVQPLDGRVTILPSPEERVVTTLAARPDAPPLVALPDPRLEPAQTRSGAGPREALTPTLPLEPSAQATVVDLDRQAPLGDLPARSPVPGASVAPGLARVASVAALAQVARVAPVAQVVAAVGLPAAPNATEPLGAPDQVATQRTRRPGNHPAAPPIAARDAAARASSGVVAAAETADAGGSAMGRESPGRERDTRDATRAAVNAIRQADAALMRAAVGGDASPAERPLQESTAIGGMERTDATERIARVLRVQESLGERPVSSVLLRLDHPDGGEDRVRVDLRGTVVGATFDVRDAAAAEHLRAHAPELQAQLGRHGLEGEAIAVRAMTRPAEASLNLASAAGAERESVRAAGAGSTSNGGAQQGQRDSRAPWRDEADPREQDHPTPRQRRDQRGQR